MGALLFPISFITNYGDENLLQIGRLPTYDQIGKDFHFAALEPGLFPKVYRLSCMRSGTSNPLSWQRPNATEAYAAEQLGNLSGYLPFPWASWIDIARDQAPPLAPFAAGTSQMPLATVGQHIEMLQHAALLRSCGVTDLFWSHATNGLSHHHGLRIHPFPLFPVRCSTHPGMPGGLPLSQRRWLYSFQGVYRPDLYLTSVRQWILELPSRSDALLESRREWHFEQAVYREQVHGQPADSQRHAELSQEASSYATALQQSVFALCPSGSGPNSIRLWEALGYGTIPVIIADTLALPGDANLWQKAALVVPETAEAVAAIPAKLEALRTDLGRLAGMQAAGLQLWRRYGLPDFVADLRNFLHDPDAVLLAAARRRVACFGEPALIIAERASALPVELRRQLRKLPSEQPLLLQILDPTPLPLLEVRWRASVQLCSHLLEGRPWALSCRSPNLELLSV